MATALITGGAGFIGSHLADALIAEGHRVRVLDDLSTGRLANIRHLWRDARFEFVGGCCTDQGCVAKAMDGANVVFHLAATVGVFRVLDGPLAAATNNLHATEAVLQAAARRRTRVVLTSSSEVYGRRADVPFREDDPLEVDPPTQARWIYASAKLMDEFLALSYWRERGVPVVLARLFNTVGPRQQAQYGMVVPRFLTRALAGEDLRVYGDGAQTRSFVDVADVVRWLLLLADHDEAVGQVYNLGNPEEISIAALAERVIRVSGANVGISYVPHEHPAADAGADVPRRVPCIDKVTCLTGHAPRIGLDASLARTSEWLRAQPSEQVSPAPPTPFAYPAPRRDAVAPSALG